MTDIENEENKIVYLTDDDELNKQKFVCLSFITPELVKNCKVRGLKVRGVYATEEEAKNRCRELNKIDPDFNIYVAPVGTWVPWCDDPDKAENTEYANEELNNLMKAYKENQVKAKMLHEQRKQDLIEKNIRESEEKKKAEVESKENNLENSNDVENEDNVLNKKRLDRDNDLTADNFKNIDKLETELANNENNIDEKKEILDNKKELLDETEDMRETIRKEIQKAKETFDKIKKNRN